MRKLAVAVILGLLTPLLQASTTPTTTATSDTLTYRVTKAVFAQINRQRFDNGRVVLHTDPRLALAVHRHSRWMARYDRMAHQLPGEPSFAQRLAKVEYPMLYAGENIGWTTELSVAGALALERLMYQERPPGDGHRRNILNPAFRHVGIGIVVDYPRHKIWMTIDFGTPR